MEKRSAKYVRHFQKGISGEAEEYILHFKEYALSEDGRGGTLLVPRLSMEEWGAVDNADADELKLLYTLCNLYQAQNEWQNPAEAGKAIGDWCLQHGHPYRYKALQSAMEHTSCTEEAMQRLASFSVDTFLGDLDKIGRAMDFGTALKEARQNRNPYFARRLGRRECMGTGPFFFAKYNGYESDEIYLQHINEDFPLLENKFLSLFPEFKLSLKKEERSGRIRMHADVNSVFERCWYTFSGLVSAVSLVPEEASDMVYVSPAYVCCMSCGRYVERKGPQQKFCNAPPCQGVRKRMNSRDFYYRKNLTRHRPE